MADILHWMKDHDTVLLWIGSVSVLVLIGMLIVVVALVACMPSDYFAAATRRDYGDRSRHPVARWSAKIVKNTLGVVLLIAGLAMLVLPGQGLLTLLVGLTLLDFPGKYELERRMIQNPAILRSVNWIRARSGRGPMEIGGGADM